MFQEDLSATTSHKDPHGYTSLLANPIRYPMGEQDHEEESTVEVSVRVEYRRGDRKAPGTTKPRV